VNITAFRAKLDGFDAILRREGMPTGPDVWQSVFLLLERLEQQGRLPNDARELAPLLGPLFCRHPEEQARFPVLFEQWLAKGPALATVNRIEAPERTAILAVRAKLKRSAWYWLAATVLLAGIGLTVLFYSKADQQVKNPLPFQGPAVDPKPHSSLPNSGTAIPLVDRVMPRPQPPPPSKVLENIVRAALNWLPWFVALLWLARTYHRRWILNRKAGSGDDLFNHFCFERVLTPIFGGAEAERALRDLRAARFQPTRRLDVAATVDATARAGDFFHPVYRHSRIASDHILLVQSRDSQDLQAALAEELAERFRHLGLTVHTYRFRDDPRRLVRWRENGGKYVDLGHLAARHSAARLLVISETDILFHPFSGKVRPWLEDFKPWPDRVWLHPHDAGQEHVALLESKKFLIFPLARASLPELVVRLTSPETRSSHPDQAYPVPLPELLAAEPEAWLSEKPPFGADLNELVWQLERFLGTYGLRLLRAVAVYPKPYWPLTQALDYLLYGHLGASDPPERREQRLARLSRLPWLTHAYLPDWLREYLLLGMEEKTATKKMWPLSKHVVTRSVFAAFAIFLLISLLTFNSEDPGWTHSGSGQSIHNAFGATGAWVADFSLFFFGLSAYLFPVVSVWEGYRIYRRGNQTSQFLTLVLHWLGIMATILSGAAMFDLHLLRTRIDLPIGSGGFLGNKIGVSLYMMLGDTVATLFLMVGLLGGITLATKLSWLTLFDLTGKCTLFLFRVLFHIPAKISQIFSNVINALKLTSSKRKTDADADVSGRSSASNFPAKRNLAPEDISERQLIIDVWRRLFAHLTDKEGQDTLSLEIRTPSKRRIKLRLNDLRALKNSENLNDPIFANILLGGKLGLLDFRLPRAMARLLPGAGKWLDLRPALVALLFAGCSVWGLNQAWQTFDKQSLNELINQWAAMENSHWQVELSYQADTERLANVLKPYLQDVKFQIAAPKGNIPFSSDHNVINYAVGGKNVARRIARRLAWLTYGAEVKLSETSTLPAKTLQVQLSRTYQHTAGFHDELRDSYQTTLNAANAKPDILPKEPAMVVIKPGTFLMGSEEERNEQPLHKVDIPYAFELGKYEVTFDEYDLFAEATGRAKPNDRGWRREDRPVINVSFADAEAYTRWLSQQTGKAYRLPTEAEWEYTARVDTTSDYYWKDYAWSILNSGDQTHPVGQKKPNAFGLYDMAGNVWEWTQDCWHESYQNAPADGSAWLVADGGNCERRVVRGSSWYISPPPHLRRTVGRTSFLTNVANDDLGFRVARAL